jgi:TRAP-type C4-dicarboxylate transport system substrate-binding protein
MVAALPSGVSAKEITLNWASFLPKSHPGTVSLQKVLFDKINERAKGELVIRYRGGPETFSSRDLGDAVQKGIVDMASALISFYQSIVPGAGSFKLSPFTPEEERKNGVYDYMAARHEKYGLKYIGRPNPGKSNYFHLYLNKKVEKPEDFKSVSIGAAGAGRPSAMAWGSSVVTLKLSEYYTAMERHLVDGINCVPLDAWVAWGCQEVTKYVPDHSYFQGTGMIIANLTSWNKIPKNLQKLIMDTMIEYEIGQIDFEIKKMARAKKKMMDAGVEFYKFSPDVEKWFLETAYSSTWAYEEKRAGKVVTDFKKLVTQ